MKKVLKNYKSTIILLLAIIVGAIVGSVWGEGAKVLSPLGDLFINLLLVLIVPLIFLTLTTSIGKMKAPKRIGKILTSILIVFIVTSLVSLAIGVVSTRPTLVNVEDGEIIKETLDMSTEDTSDTKLNILDRTVAAVSTNDFVNLLSKDNILALIVISILCGLAINGTKETNKSMSYMWSFFG